MSHQGENFSVEGDFRQDLRNDVVSGETESKEWTDTDNVEAKKKRLALEKRAEEAEAKDWKDREKEAKKLLSGDWDDEPTQG